MTDRVNISLDETAQSLWDKLKTDINEVYDGGRSEFFRDMLMKYGDDKTKLEAKRELLDSRIEKLEDEIDQLKIQRKGLKAEIEEIEVETEEESQEKIRDVDDKEFWDNTVEMIMVRRSESDPAEVESRFKRWFDGRYKKYKKNFDTVPRPRFKKQLLEEAENRGYDEKVERLR